MNTLKLFLLANLLILTATGATGEPVLPGPNALGLYFDGEAVSNKLTLGAPATVDLILIFTNPTIDFIDGWEVQVTISGGAAIVGVSLPIGTSAVLNGPSEWSAVMSEPMPCNARTKLAVFSVASEAQDETLFFLGNLENPTLISNLPAVRLPDGTWMNVPVSSGDPAVPLAGINSTTATEDASWGSVKSLFR